MLRFEESSGQGSGLSHSLDALGRKEKGRQIYSGLWKGQPGEEYWLVLAPTNLLPTGQDDHLVCRAQCKMKMQGLLFKVLKISRGQQQSIQPKIEPF